MSLWTINNAELKDLGVDNLVFNIQNQEEDYCEIRLPGNFDAALPEMFEVGAQIVIRYGADIIFQGEIDNPSFFASATMEYKSVFAYGPWHRFAAMPFLYIYPYVTGAELSTHGVIGGSANSLLTTILNTNASDLVTVGHIDVGTLTIPETEIYDQRLSETIQSILRYIPGALVVFDYSTTPPTIHIVADNSQYLASVPIDPTDGTCTGVRLSPLYNRLADGVTLQYEASGKSSESIQRYYQTGYGTSVFPPTPIPEYTGFFIVGSDSAGNAKSRRHFRRTIRMDGTFDVTKHTLSGQIWNYSPNYAGTGMQNMDLFSYGNLSYPTLGGTNRWNKMHMIDRIMFCRLFCKTSSNFSFQLDASIYASDSNMGWFDLTAPYYNINWLSDSTGYASTAFFVPLMRIGANPLVPTTNTINTLNSQPWETSNFNTAVCQTSNTSGLRAFKAGVLWHFKNTSGADGYAYTSQYNDYIVWVDIQTLQAVNTTNGRFTFIKTVNNSTNGMPPVGIAAQILAANSRLLTEGSLTVKSESNPGLFFGLSRKAVITSPACATVIQRFTLDVATGMSELTLGAPTHLGPQDLISLYRAGRGPA